ncbi:unnamed protein product [Nezara viridula]|uniref:Uncharacterized protein n=1 Tax=Nezara viridula TaxID=85310 RepID=A0A9P0MM50_NEZVI|nr:unnamed protein product [Nezara viridula]
MSLTSHEMADPQQTTSTVKKDCDLEEVGRLKIPRAKLMKQGGSMGERMVVAEPAAGQYSVSDNLNRVYTEKC